MRVCARLTPLIEEQHQPPALFLALGGCERLLLGSARLATSPLAKEETKAQQHTWPRLADALAHRLAESLPQPVHLPVGMVGLGPTRTLAWLAATRTTRGQHAVVLPGQEQAFLAPLPITVLCQVPDAAAIPALAALLATLDASGVRTLGHLHRLPAEALTRRFGASGAALAILASGGDLRPLRPRADDPWLGARLRFEPPITGQQLALALAPLAEKLAQTLAQRELVTGKLALLLESETGAPLHVTRRLAHPLATTSALLNAATRLLAGLLADTLPDALPDTLPSDTLGGPVLQPDALLPAAGERYVTLRLRVGGLHPATAEQRQLWAAEQRQATVERIERLTAALQAFSQGRHAGALLRAELDAPDAVLPEERYRLIPRSP